VDEICDEVGAGVEVQIHLSLDINGLGRLLICFSRSVVVS
jgi:hypothetical protein